MFYQCGTGKKDSTDATLAALEVLPESFKSFAKITLEMCAFAGSGDVIVIQKLLHICSESQSYAVSNEYFTTYANVKVSLESSACQISEFISMNLSQKRNLELKQDRSIAILYFSKLKS